MIREVRRLGLEPTEGGEGLEWTEVRALAKSSTAECPRGPFNEYLSMHLAMAAGLPVAAGAVVPDPKRGLVYLSLSVNVDDEQVPPAVPFEVVKREGRMAAGIAVFDTWIANNDRTPWNLAYARQPRVPLTLIDHGDAIFGTDSTLKQLQDRLGVGIDQHCLAGRLTDPDDILAWVDAIRRLPVQAITTPLTRAEALGMLTKDESDGVHHFLVHRRTHLVELLRSSNAFAATTRAALVTLV
jgi:hypothetical protein